MNKKAVKVRLTIHEDGVSVKYRERSFDPSWMEPKKKTVENSNPRIRLINSNNRDNFQK